jgi:type I restriction enzyme S subunit
MKNKWKTYRGSKLFVADKGKLPRHTTPIKSDDYLPYLTMSYLTNKDAIFANKKNVVTANKDDILIVADGSGSGNIFIGLEGAVASTFYRLRAEEFISPIFLYYLFQNTNLTKANYRKGAAIPHLDLSKVKETTFLIPEKKCLQENIAKSLTYLDKTIEKTEQIIERTEELKSGVLVELLGDKSIKTIKLNKITTKITDGTHKTPKYTESGIPFLRINDIKNDKVDLAKCKYISAKEHSELIKRCQPKKRDILLSKNGTIGVTRVVDWEEKFSIFVSLCLIQPDEKMILSEYLGLVLSSDYVLRQAKKRSKQGTVTNLHLEEIRDFNIPLPNRNIQNKIVKIISLIDDKLSAERQKLDLLNKLKSGLMQDIFSQKVEVNDEL